MRTSTFFQKNILITGISGFVGSHLANKLTSLGANVYGVSRTNDSKHILKTSVTEFSPLKDFIQKHNISLVFHLAGEALVESGQEDPYKTYKTNIAGTLNVLEIARLTNMEKVIIASTSHVYGNHKPPFYERYTPKPSRPYETSKTCTDLIAQSYARSFNLPVLIPRFVNIYGPGDLNFSRLIPRTMQSVINNQSPQMWGGRSVRDYLYIDDAIDAYIKLARIDIEKVGSSRVFNFGSGNRLPVEQVITMIIALSGKNVNIEKMADKRADEITLQYVSWSKAKKILDWQPKFSLDHGLRKTHAWYKEYFSGKKSI